MKTVEIITADPFIIEETEGTIPEFTKDDYKQRIGLVQDRMKRDDVTHVLVYGDRERFANLQYLTGYDPRYEEALAVIDASGKTSIIIGNEGYAYSFIIPYEVNRMLYQNFSLQGQPRNELVPLSSLFAKCGIDKKSRVGIIGFKFFEEGHIKDPKYSFDIPAYILQELYEITERIDVFNYTNVMTDQRSGIRLFLRSPKEIAFYEYAANKASNVIINLIRNLRPGITELELSKKAGLDATPWSVFPIVNFGAENMKIVLRSPDYRSLKLGEIVGFDFGIRGSLSARFGVAAYDEASYGRELQGSLDRFFKPFFHAVATWYEQVKIGAVSGELYDSVMRIIGGEQFGVSLNPGHNIGGDEWVNSSFYRGSEIRLPSGYYLQSDIIVSSQDPMMIGICEDGVILADKKMRDELKQEYPEVYDRIIRRWTFMKEVVGINVSEDVLPLSNLCGIYFPFLLDPTKIFALK